MKKLTTKEFIEKAIKIHGEKYDYGEVEYVKNDIRVNIYCKKCNEYFYQRPNDHMCGSGCPYCRKINTEKFIERCSIIHKYYYDYSLVNFKNSQTRIKIICPTHGIFEQRSDGHLIGKGCKKCADERLRKDTDYFIFISNKIHHNFYTYDKSVYVEAKGKVIITCPNHGDFEQLAYNHSNGNGCPKCNITNGEKLILNYLNENHILYEFQKSFIDCKGIKNKLEFDFYLPDSNTCVEFDGIQHFEPIEYFGGDKTFLRTIECDKIKTEYCLNNNIRLIRIRYDEDINDKLNLI